MAAVKRNRGFTLVEVLIAMAITAFVSVVAYTSLSSVMSGAESLRENTDRIYQLNRAWMIISRDMREFVARPVRDEFGAVEPALTGGELARFDLSFTRAGWHNPNAYPRSNLQRINYRIEDDALWRDSYTVLDRAGNSEPQTVLLLEQLENIELSFLGTLDEVQLTSGTGVLDTTSWAENWVLDSSNPQAVLDPPVALVLTLQLQDMGEMRRLYALPPL